MFQRSLMALLGVLFITSLGPTLFAAGRAKYFGLVVWDGMRADFVSPAQSN